MDKKLQFQKIERTLKRGDMRDGLYFWNYQLTAKNFELWLTKEKFDYQRERKRRSHYSKANQKRRKTPMARLAHSSRQRVIEAFKNQGYSKTKRTAKMLGCSYGVLNKHLEEQFAEGMTWENRGEWHVDHRLPLAAARNTDELVALCHYTNLQPMWASDNKAKYDKYCPVELEVYLSSRLDTYC